MADVVFTLTLDGSSVVRGTEQLKGALDNTNVPIQRLVNNFVGFSRELLEASGNKDRFIENLNVLRATLEAVVASQNQNNVSLEQQVAAYREVAEAVSAAAERMQAAAGRIDGAFQNVVAGQRGVTQAGRNMREEIDSSIGLFARLFVIQRITKDFSEMEKALNAGTTRLIEIQQRALTAGTSLQALGQATDEYSRRIQEANNATFFSAATAKLFGDIMKGMEIPIDVAARALTAYEEKLVSTGKSGKDAEELLLRLADSIERVTTRGFKQAEMEVNLARGHAMRTGEAAKSIATMDTQTKQMDLLFDSTRQAEEATGTMAASQGSLYEATNRLNTAETNLQLTLSEASERNFIGYRNTLASVLNVITAVAQGNREAAATFVSTGNAMLQEAIFAGNLLERVTSYAYFMTQIVRVEQQNVAARSAAAIATKAETVAVAENTVALEADAVATGGLATAITAGMLPAIGGFAAFLVSAAAWLAPVAAGLILITGLIGVLTDGFKFFGQATGDAEAKQRAFTQAAEDGRATTEQVAQALAYETGNVKDLAGEVRKLQVEQEKQKATENGVGAEVLNTTTQIHLGNQEIAQRLLLLQQAREFIANNPHLLSSHGDGASKPPGEPTQQEFLDRYKDFGDKLDDARAQIDEKGEKGIVANEAKFKVSVGHTIEELARGIRSMREAVDQNLEENRVTAEEAAAQVAKIEQMQARLDSLKEHAGGRVAAHKQELLAGFDTKMDAATADLETRTDGLIAKIQLWEEEGAKAGAGKLVAAYVQAHASLTALQGEMAAGEEQATKATREALAAAITEMDNAGGDEEVYNRAAARVQQLLLKLSAQQTEIGRAMAGAAALETKNLAKTTEEMGRQVDEALDKFDAQVAASAAKTAGNLQEAALGKEDKAYATFKKQLEDEKHAIQELVQAMGAKGDTAGATEFQSRLARVNEELYKAKEAHEAARAEIEGHPLKYGLEELQAELPGLAEALKAVWASVVGTIMGGFDSIARRREQEKVADLQFSEGLRQTRANQTAADAAEDHRQNLARIRASLETEQEKNKQISEEDTLYYRKVRDLGQQNADAQRAYAHQIADAHRTAGDSITDVWLKTMDKLKEKVFTTLIEQIGNEILPKFHKELQDSLDVTLSAGGGGGGFLGGFLGILGGAVGLIPGIGPALALGLGMLGSQVGNTGTGYSGGYYRHSEDSSGDATQHARGIVARQIPNAAMGGVPDTGNNQPATVTVQANAPVTFAPTFNGVPQAIADKVQKVLQDRFAPQIQQAVEEILDMQLRDPGVGVVG